MPDIRYDHEGFEQAAGRSADALDESTTTGRAEHTDGVEAAVLEAIEADDAEQRDRADKGKEDADTAKEASGEAEAEGEATAGRIGGVGAESHLTGGDATTGGGHAGASPAAGAGAPGTSGSTAAGSSGGGHGLSGAGGHGPAGGAAPSAGASATPPAAAGGMPASSAAPSPAGSSPLGAASLPPAASPLGRTPTPSITPMAPSAMPMADGGESMMAAPMMMPAQPTPAQPMAQYEYYTPTPATATQYDVNHAPNREELADAIYEAVNSDAESGLWGTGTPGDSRPRVAGSDPGSVGELSDDEFSRRSQEVQQDFVNRGIWYAWGGGHGELPGVSQGVSDGGGQADRMGDYAKQGLDCSGYARAQHYETTGVDIGPTTAADQYNMGTPVAPEDARPGDFFFPDSAGRPPTHVQVYAGNGQVSEAQQSGTQLMFSPLTSGEFRRFN